MPNKDEQSTDKIRPLGEQSLDTSAATVLRTSSTNLPAGYAPKKPQAPKVQPKQSIPPYGALAWQALPEPAPTPRATLYFPFTRQALNQRQYIGMLSYSLLMAVCIMVLSLANLNNAGSSSFVRPDGSVNGFAILLTLAMVFLLAPACSLLCGVFFGSWRGLLVSVLSIGSGILITHLVNNLFWSNQPLQSLLPLLGLPMAAYVVGLIYERRSHAAWWKSLLTMLLGATIVSLWMALATILLTLNSPNFRNAANASPNPQAFIAELWVGGIVLAVLGILALTFPIAGIEGLIHWGITAQKRKA